jgi:octaprenyl-diphosphate synthase
MSNADTSPQRTSQPRTSSPNGQSPVPATSDGGEEKAFRAAFELVNPSLYSVEERIRQQARQFDPAVEGYVNYVCDTGGKRLRPVLALLSAGATGKVATTHLDLAVILELIHVASLVHDDIMDGADVRREKPTANAKWGNAISVLLGDALFSHALRLATGFDNSEVCRRIADASVDVCSGEIIQTQRRFDLKLSLQDYYKIIEMKTAALFSAACELSALLNGATPECIKALQSFGRRLGSAYQIYDDCVDLVGSEAEAGKTLGTDLRKGKFTLPVLVLLQGANGSATEKARTLLLGEEEEAAAELALLLQSQGALKHSIETARRLVGEAAGHLGSVPENEFSLGLRSIARYVDFLLRQLQS